MLNCRLCSSEKLNSIIPLGKLPLANALLHQKPQKPCPRYNLEVMLCENCGLAQLKDLIDPKLLFTDYVYFSSNSDTMLRSAKLLVDKITSGLNDDAFVIEIASNDGYLLKNYVQKGIDVLGIDPAENIAKIANANNIPTRCAFFNLPLAKELCQTKHADVIHANNVMAHVPELVDFVKAIKLLLSPTGTAIIEVPYLLHLVRNLEFDTIYHEHVFYFALKPLAHLFNTNGLVISDLEDLDIHGGSLRIYLKHDSETSQTNIVNQRIQTETDYGLYSLDLYKTFMHKLEDLRESLQTELAALRDKGAKIAAYGASAKGTTLLNFFGIDANSLHFVADRSEEKIGKYTPGKGLKILSPKELSNQNISHALMLAWNFADEIISQQQEFRAKGGKFIIPLPQVAVLS